MELEHPNITKMINKGFLVDDVDLGLDDLENELQEGDEVLEFDDYVFLVDELETETIVVLEMIGAEYGRVERGK